MSGAKDDEEAGLYIHVLGGEGILNEPVPKSGLHDEIQASRF